VTVRRSPGLDIRSKRFDWGAHTYLMGIVNLSPDSFSGDGLTTVEEAVAQARRFEAEGADIIDVGAMSTRPNFEELTIDAETARIVPAVRSIVASVSLPVSVDAYRAPVMRAALDAGAHMVNDIWGFRHDPEVASVAAEAGVPAVVMHNQRGRPFDGVIDGIRAGFNESLGIADSAGLPRERVMLDPGFGFGWTVEQNVEMLDRLGELRDFGLPLLIGTSRKSTVGAVLERPEGERLMGTAATVAIAIARGADIVRVHDVAEMKQVCIMTDAIVRRRSPS
jgi:dihydropteroate synthase